MIARLAHNERGSAMVAAMAVLMLSLMLGGAAVERGVVLGAGAQRDVQGKRALQAADAGLRAAIDRLNAMAIERQTAYPCVGWDGTRYVLTGEDPAMPGWCREIPEVLADGTSYRYRVSVPALTDPSNGSDNQVLSTRTVIATGSSFGRQRRVSTQAAALVGRRLFGANGVISLEDLTIDQHSSVTGNVLSNGNITLNNNVTLCGTPYYGPGKDFAQNNNATLCPGNTATEAPDKLVLSPLEAGNLATQNDNSRICGLDPCNGNVTWDATARRLTLRNNATLTLGGNVYFFCQLELYNSSQLIIAPQDPTKAVRIYMDDPANCGGTGGSVVKDQSAAIVNQFADPTGLQLYVLGSEQVATSVAFSNNASGNGRSTAPRMTIYAPWSMVKLGNYTDFTGAIAAKKVEIGQNSSITYSPDAGQLQTENTVFPLYRSRQYRECATPTASSSPTEGC